jgi:hypothetical protein
MTTDIMAMEERAEFPFPTPPASDDGKDRGKRAGNARHGGDSSDDDGCEGCRKISRDEAWRFERQKKSMGECIPSVSMRIGWVEMRPRVCVCVCPCLHWCGWHMATFPSPACSTCRVLCKV